MPLYMDLHKLQGVTPDALANAHLKDLDVQDKYGVRYLRYWFNEPVGKIFCLAEAPSADVAIAVHREAHGLLPDEIIEVEGKDVEGFLGTAEEVPRGQTPPSDTAFRAVLFTDIEGSTALTQRLGDTRAMEMLRLHDSTVRGVLSETNGREIKHTATALWRPSGRWHGRWSARSMSSKRSLPGTLSGCELASAPESQWRKAMIFSARPCNSPHGLAARRWLDRLLSPASSETCASVRGLGSRTGGEHD